MTRQEIQAIVLSHIDEELRESPSIAERVANAFILWFQQLVAPLPAPTPTEGEQNGETK